VDQRICVSFSPGLLPPLAFSPPSLGQLGGSMRSQLRIVPHDLREIRAERLLWPRLRRGRLYRPLDELVTPHWPRFEALKQKLARLDQGLILYIFRFHPNSSA